MTNRPIGKTHTLFKLNHAVANLPTIDPGRHSRREIVLSPNSTSVPPDGSLGKSIRAPSTSNQLLARTAHPSYDERMAMDDLRHQLTQDPFQPFRVRLTSGDFYDIRDPVSAAMMKSRLFIADPKSDRSVYVPYLHIAALETVANGRKKRHGRRGK